MLDIYWSVVTQYLIVLWVSWTPGGRSYLSALLSLLPVRSLCPALILSADIVSWINIRLFNANPFLIKSVILRQDLKIYGFLTRANLLIRGPQEGILCHILPDLFEIIPKIQYICNVIIKEDLWTRNYLPATTEINITSIPVSL